ncbi:autotransporter domain-containing protein [Sphingopyxis sp. LARHCG72]
MREDRAGQYVSPLFARPQLRCLHAVISRPAGIIRQKTLSKNGSIPQVSEQLWCMRRPRLRLPFTAIRRATGSGNFRMKKQGIVSGKAVQLLLATSGLASVLGMPQPAQAMDFHRSGDKIYASGTFDLGDDVKLRRMLDAADDADIVITTVVFRGSNGGAAVAGTGMGKLIRDRRLDTAVQGGCYSACTAGVVGGVGRHDAVDDLPLFHSRYARTIFGIHGSATTVQDPEEYDVSVTTVSSDQSSILAHYRGLLGDEIPAEAMERIDYAITHLTDSQGFLRYFVNDAGKTTTYCPGGSQATDCIPYPGVTIRSDGIINAGTLDLSDDYLWVRGTASGNINPNFRRFSADPEAGDAPSLDEAHGVVRVADGGVWHMTEATGADIIAAERGGTIIVEPGTNAPAELVEDEVTLNAGFITIDLRPRFAARPTSTWITASDGGTIDLRGGTLASDLLTTVVKGGRLSGFGTVASNLSVGAGGILAPEGIAVQPFLPLYQRGSASPSRVTLIDQDDVRLTLETGSETLFNVAAEVHAPNIRLIDAEVIVSRLELFFVTAAYGYVAERHRGRLVIAPGATATLDVRRGFFAPDARSTLVGVEHIEGPARANPEDFQDDDPTVDVLKLFGFFNSKISHKPIIEGSFATVRRDANDAGITFADGAIFSPRENSLLTFTLHQDAESIYMVANPAFDDTQLFGNRRSGNGLGDRLRAASYEADTPLAPLLGALQFADRDIARREGGSLRGDGHASLRLATGGFANLFATTLRTQVGAMRRLNGANFVAEGKESAAVRDDSGTRFWVAGFGQSGHIASDGAVDRMKVDSYGSLFGVSRQIGGDVDVGFAFGYGRMDGRERPGSGIDSRTRAYGGSLYGDFSYGRGHVSAQAGYHRLKNRSNRSIIGIEGLEDLNRATYSNDAITAGLEHGFTLNPGSKTRITAVVPTVEYMRLGGIDFAETGGPAALTGSAGAYESIRVGGGLEISGSMTTTGGQRFAPYARVLYKRELNDRDAILGNGFLLDPAPAFAAASRRLGRDVIEWGTGISSPADQAVTVSLDYVAQAGKGFQSHSAKIGFNVRF